MGTSSSIGQAISDSDCTPARRDDGEAAGPPALTTAGRGTVAIVADVVGLFALTQRYAVWRTRWPASWAATSWA